MSEIPSINPEKLSTGTPFRDNLEETEYNSRGKIKKLEAMPHKLVREVSPPGEHVSEILEKLHQSNKVMQKLQDQYSIATPNREIVIGKIEQGVTKVFTVIDRIEGKNLDELKTLSPEKLDNLDTLYANMARYFLDAYKSNSEYWSDFDNFQFVLGHAPDEKTDRPYLVDIDPITFRLDAVTPNERIQEVEALFGNISRLYTRMRTTERKFGNTVYFHRAREAFQRIMEDLSGDEPQHRIIKNLKTRMGADLLSDD